MVFLYALYPEYEGKSHIEINSKMKINDSIRHTAEYIRNVRSTGRYAFSIDDLLRHLPKSVRNIRKDIDRLRKKGDVITIRKGFYTIIPDEYKNMGVIPVEFYIDELMTYLEKKYYVGLYSAAMFHGAAHQQPQEFYVICDKPRPRSISNDKFLINFTEKVNYPIYGIEKKKTDTGYFNISGVELTLLDMIYMADSLGGYSRIVSVLVELGEKVTLVGMKEAIKNDFPISVYQRAGFIAEKILKNEKLALLFENKLSKQTLKTLLLKPAGDSTGVKLDRWRLICNVEIENDL